MNFICNIKQILTSDKMCAIINFGVKKMLNINYKKEAIAILQKAYDDYSVEYDIALKKANVLYNKKLFAVDSLKKVETYFNIISNKPHEIAKVISEISIRRKEGEKILNEIKVESKKVDETCGFATGVAAGALTILPRSLLCGTPLLLGGTRGLLLLGTGPIGWAISGATMFAGGLMANSKNKEIAEKAEQQTIEIKTETEKLKEKRTKIIAEIELVESLFSNVIFYLRQMESEGCRNYDDFTKVQKDKLMLLVNTAESLSKRIGDVVS